MSHADRNWTCTRPWTIPAGTVLTFSRPGAFPSPATQPACRRS